MEKNEIEKKVIIRLIGENAKRMFLEELTQKSKIKFAEIPKEEIILQEKGDAKETKAFFEKILENGLLGEVSFDSELRERTAIDTFKGGPLGKRQQEIMKVLSEDVEGKGMTFDEISEKLYFGREYLRKMIFNLEKKKFIKSKELPGYGESLTVYIINKDKYTQD